MRAEVLRAISLKFHNSFRVKLFVYRFFERTLSMAETTLLLVWNTIILSPLNADHESLESGTVKISWLLKNKTVKQTILFTKEKTILLC